MLLLTTAICWLLVPCVALLSAILYHRIKYFRRTKRKTWAFFHPYCSSGGGGERVLWKMVQVLSDLHYKGWHVDVVIYTVDPPSPTYKQDLLKHVDERFSIAVSDGLALSFIHLHDHEELLSSAPRFSLLMESLGTMQLAYQGLLRQYKNTGVLPDIFLDTTGCAFTFVVASILFGSRIIPYVHYPTISTDMLQLVWERRRSSYNHQDYISSSRVTTYVKLLYYIGFAVLYGMVGSLSTLVLVNSTWTYNHIQSLWKGAAWSKDRIRILYPPCRVAVPSKNGPKREKVVLSIGQFRPEKDHNLQLEAFAYLLENHAELRGQVQLVLLGGCRGESDQRRLEALQVLAGTLQLESSVQFVVNQKYSVVEHWLQKSSVGIHTMWNEHFGIGIVEMMAAGLIVVAHNSGGPKLDIVTEYKSQSTGFLATTKEEYAQAMYRAFTMGSAESQAMRQAAQKSASRFSDVVFAKSFEEILLQANLL